MKQKSEVWKSELCYGQITLLILRTLGYVSEQILLTSSIILKPAALLLESSQPFPQAAVHCKSTVAWISHSWISVFNSLLHG